MVQANTQRRDIAYLSSSSGSASGLQLFPVVAMAVAKEAKKLQREEEEEGMAGGEGFPVAS